MGKEKSKSKRKERDEDPEERERRRSRKKSEKIAKMFGYSNDTNPFGDSNLLQPFVWGKKKEKDRALGKEDEDTEEHRLKLIQDIDRVRKRRAEREQELEDMERLRAEETRLREAAQYGDWEQKEEDFHIAQTKVRSKIRLIENREKPIDILATNILLIESVSSTNKEDRDMAVDLANLKTQVNDPLLLVDGLDDKELSDLLNDVESYVEIEKKRDDSSYLAFWKALKDVVGYERKRRNRRESTLHKSVMADVQKMFDGKLSNELLKMRDDIRKSIREGRRSDVEYWEQMEKEVCVEYSRAIVREVHRDLLAKQMDALSILKEEAEERAKQRAASGEGERKKSDREKGEYRFVEAEGGSGGGPNDFVGGDSGWGGTSHPAATSSVVEDLAVEGNVDDSTDALQMVRREEDKGLEEMEEAMKSRDEVRLTKTYAWQDKYSPRKPRYFNKVKTGFDWNKYNKTHYDYDNPPPKTVQGYKFNIFYPDLIDKSHTPRYYLEASDEPEFAVLRFHSGPPYEDIAFKIVNQEWDTGKRSGFRCVFERGVLYLYFNFKRHFYRR